MVYVDGFVIPIPKRNVAAYKRMAKAAAKSFKKYGAIEVRECVADDLSLKDPMTGKRWSPFPRMAKLKRGETLLFSWVTYPSKARRDAANEKIMKDPVMAAMMDGKAMPFDTKRMAMGGFKVIVDA
jgi:uncharacterized protein YbaA (DUF1428 family)